MISGFDKEYRFLSNFYNRGLTFRGKYYATSEHAYAAHKATNEYDHRLIQSQSSPRMAKIKGQQIKCRNDWEDIKYDLMLEIVRAKFQDPYLKELLDKTGDEYLEETNHWHDNVFGNCVCEKCEKIHGQNWLGKILMIVRNENKNL